VPNDDNRKRCSLGTYGGDETLQVVQQVFEATHVAASAAGSTVALMVVGVDFEAGVSQIRCRVFVPPTVFSIAVNENDDSFRASRNPGSPKQQRSRRSRKMGFRAADVGVV
jgi:hypothetical protein